MKYTSLRHVSIPFRKKWTKLNLQTCPFLTGGNSSALPRQVYIINCRPAAMVEEERRQKFDHGLAGLDSIELKAKQASEIN